MVLTHNTRLWGALGGHLAYLGGAKPS